MTLDPWRLTAIVPQEVLVTDTRTRGRNLRIYHRIEVWHNREHQNRDVGPRLTHRKSADVAILLHRANLIRISTGVA